MKYLVLSNFSVYAYGLCIYNVHIPHPDPGVFWPHHLISVGPPFDAVVDVGVAYRCLKVFCRIVDRSSRGILHLPPVFMHVTVQASCYEELQMTSIALATCYI